MEKDKDDNDNDTDEDIPQSRKCEKEWRSSYFDIPGPETHGRGKRERKQTQHFSFLQTKFEHLEK